MSSSICPFCNQSVNLAAIFCNNCGSNLNLPTKIASFQDISSKLVIDRDYLEQYRELTEKIEAFAGFEIEVQQQKDHYTFLAKEYQKTQVQLQALDEEVKAEHRDIEELQKISWSGIKARLKGKMEERLKKEESEYLEALHRYEAMEISMNNLKQKMTRAEEQFDELQNYITTKKNLEHQRKELIYKAAEGVTDIVEDSIEIKLSDYSEKLDPFLVKKSRLQAALSGVTQALDLFSEAITIFDSNNDDLEKFTGNGLLIDSVKKSNMAEVRNIISQAVQCLNQSYELMQQLEADTSIVSIDGGTFWERFMNSFIAELTKGSRLSQTKHQIQKAIQDNNKIISWLNSQISAVSVHINELLIDIKDLQQELMFERERMIKEALDKKN